MDGNELVVGAALSLSGGDTRQARMAAAGLAQAVDDVRHRGGIAVAGRRVAPRLVLLDDGGTAAGLRRCLEALTGADLLVGPYGSGLTGDAAQWAAGLGRVLWNHGGSADAVEAMPAVVSVSSPTSRYLAAVLEVVAPDLPGGRVLVAAGTGSFGQAAATGAVEAATRLGLDVIAVVRPSDVTGAPDADVLLLAGSFSGDVAALRSLERRPPVVAAVAAGLAEFPDAIGARWADGVLAPSQWEEGVHMRPDLGPRPADVLRALRSRLVPRLGLGGTGAHVDYPAAQAYAAALIAFRCVEEAGTTDDDALLAAARRLRATTFFGRFGLDGDGRQADHELLVVQWQEGVKRIVGPRSLAEESPMLGRGAR